VPARLKCGLAQRASDPGWRRSELKRSPRNPLLVRHSWSCNLT
jgi:hypothetical protein